jgi:outer membrane receptor for ferrienterochelin and colicins
MHRCWLILLLFVPCLMPVDSSATDAAVDTLGGPASLVEMDETVVSASRRAEPLLLAPAAITRIDTGQVRADASAGVYTAIVRRAKGIDYVQNSVLGETVNSRGFNSAFNYRMLILVDGRVTSAPSIGLPLNNNIPVVKEDIEAIEIVTGPSAALFGPDATSGLVNITTVDPRRWQGTRASLALGSRRTLKGRVFHSGVHQRWSWKASAGVEQARDYDLVNTFANADGSMSVTDDPDLDARILRGGITIGYDQADGRRWRLAVGASTADFLGISSLGRTQLTGLVNHYEQLTYDSDRWSVNLYHLGDDLGDTHGLEGKAEALLAGLSPAAAREAARYAGHSSTWELEGRRYGQVSWLRATRIIVGANLRQYRPETDGRLLDDADGHIVLEQYGVFAQAVTDLHERLRLIVAARTDRHEVYGTQVSPRLGLVYRPRSELALRATYNRAFQSPSLGHQSLLVRINDSVVARGNGQGFRFTTLDGTPVPPEYYDGIEPIRPEESTSWETGLRTVLAGRVLIDVTAYRSRYEDFVSPLQVIGDIANGVVITNADGEPRPEVTLTYRNFGRRTLHGVDASLEGRVNGSLAVWGNLSLLDAGAPDPQSGLKQPLNTPGRIGNVGLSLTDLGLHGSRAGLSLRHVTRHTFRSGVHDGTVPAYLVVDLSASLPLGVGQTWRLSVRNLLDNRHREFVSGPRIGRLIVTEVGCAW